MALTLDATLAAAQDNQNRKPLVDIIAAGAEMETLPMPAYTLQSSDDLDQHPNALMLSTGRIVVVYAEDSKIRWGISDAERLEMSFQTSFTGTDIDSPAIVEMDDTKVGLIYLDRQTGVGNYVKYKICDSAGGVISGGTVDSYLSTDWISEPFVIRLANTNYMAVWVTETTNVYTIHKAISSDFATWVESTVSIGGLLNSRHTDHPSLVQMDTGDIFLWFDYVTTIDVNDAEISNIYYSISDDNGSTWSDAVQCTTYDSAIVMAEHPVAYQDDTASQLVTYTEKTTSFHKAREGLPYGDAEWCGPTEEGEMSSVQQLSWDWVNRKVYCINGNNYYYHPLFSVVRIDLDTWEIDKCWGYARDGYDPGFHELYGRQAECHPPWAQPPQEDGNACRTNIDGWNDRHDRHWIAVAVHNSYYGNHHIGIALLNGEADWIRHYWNYTLWDGAEWTVGGVEKNVNISGDEIHHICIDAGNMNMWYQTDTDEVGYIDMSDTIPDPYYDSTVWGSVEKDWCTDMRVYPDLNMIVFAYGSSTNAVGKILVYSISEAGLLKTYNYANDNDFPKYGVRKVCYMDGALWGSVYTRSDGLDDYKNGLVRCDLTTDEVTIHAPEEPYGVLSLKATMAGIEATENHEIVGGQHAVVDETLQGFWLYDTVRDSWIQSNNDSVAGLMPFKSGSGPYSVIYDALTGTVVGGVMWRQNYNWWGVIALNKYGLLRSNQYFNLTYSGGSWDVGDVHQLTDGIADFHAVPLVDPDEDFMYAFWTRQIGLDYDLFWGREGTELITPFLVGEVKRIIGIDGNPSKLSFSVARGHLFDPYHQTSLLSPYFQRGAKVYLRFGELVSDVEYWQDFGVYYVDDISLKYQRGEYPVLQVTAQDLIVFMEDHQGITTQQYTDTYPQYVLQDILETHASLDYDTELDIPDTIENQTKLTMQWVDEDLMDIIEELCDRFGYYWKVNVDGEFTIRYIDDSNPVDHTYSDLTKIIDFTPDHKYSEWTNQVKIHGETLEEEDVTHAEEPVVTSHGTFGWWGYKKTFEHYYSDDKKKRCAEPRMTKVEDAATSIIFDMLGDVKMYIQSSTETKVVVRVQASDLTGALIAALIALGASFLIPDGVVVFGFLGSTGVTIPVGSIVQAGALAVVFDILASIGNYQYEISARPITTARREFTVIVDDLDLQYEMRRIVSKEWNDPLCYTVEQAQWRADREMKYLQWQRKRVTFSKIAHLQDEEGDTIQINHPYTGTTMKIFIVKLTRRFRFSDKGGRIGSGHFIDDIEGWIVG